LKCKNKVVPFLKCKNKVVPFLCYKMTLKKVTPKIKRG
nr:RecName: Full=Hemextin B; AltName: Full=Hemachatus extrinsic tenase inhibitor B [Hemachatus haemachatus]